LAQITNKCNNDNEDLDYYIKECGDILGVTGKIDSKGDPKAILSFIFGQIANFKKLNP
jgi:intraflagellar transport protein 52